MCGVTGCQYEGKIANNDPDNGRCYWEVYCCSAQHKISETGLSSCIHISMVGP